MKKLSQKLSGIFRKNEIIIKLKNIPKKAIYEDKENNIVITGLNSYSIQTEKMDEFIYVDKMLGLDIKNLKDIKKVDNVTYHGSAEDVNECIKFNENEEIDKEIKKLVKSAIIIENLHSKLELIKTVGYRREKNIENLPKIKERYNRYEKNIYSVMTFLIAVLSSPYILFVMRKIYPMNLQVNPLIVNVILICFVLIVISLVFLFVLYLYKKKKLLKKIEIATGITKEIQIDSKLSDIINSNRYLLAVIYWKYDNPTYHFVMDHDNFKTYCKSLNISKADNR